MTNPVADLLQTTAGTIGGPKIGAGVWVWCPGCDYQHRFAVEGKDGSKPDGPCWGWDGNLEAPTFEGSMLLYEIPGKMPRCHSYLRSGRWEFLSDCTHDLAGQTVDMVPLPDWLAER